MLAFSVVERNQSFSFFFGKQSDIVLFDCHNALFFFIAENIIIKQTVQPVSDPASLPVSVRLVIVCVKINYEI